MWIVIKEKIKNTNSFMIGGKNPTNKELVIDRIVQSLEDVNSGEIFAKINIKK